MLRRSLAQIGGPYAVTFWAWLITLPLTVLVSSVYATPPSLRDVVVWTTALIAVHAGVGLIMLLARLTVLPARPRRARPVTALVVFALLGLARAILLSAAQEWTGLGAFDLSERISFNVVASMVLFAAIAIVIDEFRTDAEITRRLQAAQQTLTALREREESELLHADEQILAQVRDQLESELRAEHVSAQRLRSISEAVVRGVSHELAEPVSSKAVLDVSAIQPPRWRTLASTVTRMQVPPALLVMVPLELIIFPSVAARFSVAFALVNAVMGGAPTVLGLWLLRRYLPLPRHPLPRLLTLGVAVALVVAATSALNIWTAAFLVDDFFVSIPAVAAGITGLTLVASGWIAAAEGRSARQQDMTAMVGREAQEVARLQGLLNERRLAAARFLHGTVQNELVAASLRGDTLEEVQSSIEQAFASYASASQSESREVFEGLIRSWSTVLDITVDVDESTWNTVADDVRLGALLVDVVAEGLTNAVRHASGRSVSIQVSASEGVLTIRMETEGELRISESRGFGLQDMQQRGADVRLESGSGTTILTGQLG